MEKRIKCCRISGNENLVPILNLGVQELTGVFPKTREEPVTSGPLELVWCPESKLLQLSCSFALEEMYSSNYGYRSGINPTMVSHLSEKIRSLETKFEVSAGDWVVDVGSNDATALKSYQTAGINRIGIDPVGRKFLDCYPPEIQLIPSFFPTSELSTILDGKKVKILTSIAVFYDLEDPISFARSVSQVLAKTGIWHLEQSYLPTMIENTSFDTICHEHLEYYSLHSIQFIMQRADLKILDVQMNQVNGGSFAVTVAHRSSPLRSNDRLVKQILAEEATMGFDTQMPFRAFEKAVFERRQNLRSLIKKLTADGHKVFGYGASTKGNVVLQFCEFSANEIPFMVEISPDKFGSYTPKTHIPIISSAEAAILKPDYYLVLPWHFKDAIIEREVDFLNSGGKLIFPFPEIEIIGGENRLSHHQKEL